MFFTEKGYEYELTQKQKFYLYLYSVCPSIDILDFLWKSYTYDNLQTAIEFHDNLNPLKIIPIYDKVYHKIYGFIDPDRFMIYYKPRENYLLSVKVLRNPDFICKLDISREELETSCNYFDRLINQPTLKLTNSKKTRVLEMVIQSLSKGSYNLTLDQIVRYIYSMYNMYNNVRILRATPLAIDNQGKLCRFD